MPLAGQRSGQRADCEVASRWCMDTDRLLPDTASRLITPFHPPPLGALTGESS